MKSFKEYLTESTNEHKMTLRFASELDDGSIERIERFLGKYDLRTISRVSTTPITKNPLFFSKEVVNTKVSKVDITTGYPMSADILRQQLSDLLEINITHIAVHPEGWEPAEEPVNNDDKKALLDTDYDDVSDNGKHYGRTFIDSFLKSLLLQDSRDHVEVENPLSPKAKRDKAANIMTSEDSSSDSVISGDKK